MAKRSVRRIGQWKCWQPPFIGFKILSVLLAVFLWGYVTITQNPLSEATYTVPIELRNLASDLAQLDTNYQAQVRVQGSGGAIAELSSRDIVAYVDLSGMRQGEVTPEVRIELPENISLVSVSPTNLTLNLEVTTSSTFALSARTVGEPAEGYSLLDPVLSPNAVRLSGTAENISKVAAVYVSAEVEGLETNYSANLTIEVQDAAGNNITSLFFISPSTANLVIPVIYEQPEAQIPVRAVTVGSTELGYTVSRVVVEPSYVRAFGDLAELDALYYLETEPIDISGLRSNANFSARITPHAGITLAVDTVTVVVQIEPEAAASFSRNLLYCQNLPEEFLCDLPELEFTVVISGPSTYVNKAVAADVIPYVDASSVTGPGQYTLPILVSLPANTNLASISLDTAVVTIREKENGTPNLEE